MPLIKSQAKKSGRKPTFGKHKMIAPRLKKSKAARNSSKLLRAFAASAQAALRARTKCPMKWEARSGTQAVSAGNIWR
jgi:hypothetical protein